MDKQAIWWAGFFAGSVSTTVVNWALQYVYSTLKRNKERQSKKDSRYETIVLDYGTFVIPKSMHDDEYNKYVNGYDKCIRKNFEEYIRDNVQKWWDEYESTRRRKKELLARTICKYVKVEPLRINGALSDELYAYVEHGAFNVKVRCIQSYYDELYNMEMKITNTNITEDDNGN